VIQTTNKFLSFKLKTFNYKLDFHLTFFFYDNKFQLFMFHAFCILWNVFSCHMSALEFSPHLPSQNWPSKIVPYQPSKYPPNQLHPKSAPQHPAQISPIQINPQISQTSPQIYPFEISSKSVSNLPPKHPPKICSQYNPHICHTQNCSQNPSKNAFIWSKLNEQENSNWKWHNN